MALLVPVSGQATTFYKARLDGPTAGRDSLATGTAILILNAGRVNILIHGDPYFGG